MMNETKNLIVDKSFDFALAIVELYKKMIANHEYVLSKQVLRSGTSIGANLEEALAGHSKRDFLAKMIISHKEARETRYWLRLIEKGGLSKDSVNGYLNDISDIINILSAIISTSKKSLGISAKIFFYFFNLSLLLQSFHFKTILNS